MRLRFFLWASADLGVRRSNVESSFCRSGYIMVSEITQAGSRAAIRFPGSAKAARDIASEEKLQGKLHQPRIACLCDLAKQRSVRSAAVRIEKLSVVENIEELGAEIHALL